MIDNIIQLETDLNRVFDESLPTWPGLPAQSARIAVMMHRAGRDAYAIAERIEMPIGSVLAFLDRLKKAEAKKAARAQAQSEPAPTEADDNSEPLAANAPQSELALAQTPPPKLPAADVELTGLQLALIRRLRKARVSADTIARVMRLSPDQVQRIAGEIP